MYKPVSSDFGCVLEADFEGLKGNPQALIFERHRLEENLHTAKDHLAKLRGMRVQQPWLSNRISFQLREIRKLADLLNFVMALIGDAPRHVVR